MEHNILIPNLMVKNVADTVRFYQDILGFTLLVAMQHVENDNPMMVMELEEGMRLEWANMSRAGAEFMFQERQSFIEDVPTLEGVSIGASQSIYITLDQDVNAHYEDLKDKVTVIVEPVTKFYGMREWYMQDCNGYVLCFAETVGEMEG